MPTTKQELIAKLIAALLDGDTGDTFAAILSAFGSIASLLATAGVKALHTISKSVGKLNANIELVVKRTDDHSDTLVDHEARLRVAEAIRRSHEEEAS